MRETIEPWGHYEVLEDAPTHKVKRIEVRPGRRLSYQRHVRRAEHWFIEAWRQVYRWLRVAFWGAWGAVGVKLVLGDGPADQGVWWPLYLAVWGLFLLCDTALRAAARRQARSGAEAIQGG